MSERFKKKKSSKKMGNLSRNWNQRRRGQALWSNWRRDNPKFSFHLLGAFTEMNGEGCIRKLVPAEIASHHSFPFHRTQTKKSLTRRKRKKKTKIFFRLLLVIFFKFLKMKRSSSCGGQHSLLQKAEQNNREINKWNDCS